MDGGEWQVSKGVDHELMTGWFEHDLNIFGPSSHQESRAAMTTSSGVRRTPSFIPDIKVNLSEYCRLEGGRILPGELALCAVPQTIIPDPSSCYSGPNSSFWVEGTGCVGNLVNSCLTLSTYKSWGYKGGDIVCTYDFSDNLCGPPDDAKHAIGDGTLGGSRQTGSQPTGPSVVQPGPKILPAEDQ